MAKANRYTAYAYAADGEPLLADERFTSMSDRAAWAEAIKRAFANKKDQERQGYLMEPVHTIEVTRL